MLKRFFRELQRRNVLKSALAYLVVAWLLTQVLAIIIPAFELPSSLLRTSIIVLSICLPFWLVFSWIYEITPDGIKKTKNVFPEDSIAYKTNNRLNYVILAGLIVATGFLVRSAIYSSANNGIGNNALETQKSIAVLAFTDMSPQKDQEYFSDGISEEILNLLTKVPDLMVISRTSSFSYKGREVNIKTIGKELNVTHILEGSIRKSGNTFRITAQLIDAITGTHIWSETFDRSMEDIFMIQDEIAKRVTQQLEISLMGKELVSQRVDPDAYLLLLKAAELMFNDNSIKKDSIAINLVKESIAIDKTYSRAWYFLSLLYRNMGYKYGTMPMSDAMEKGKEAAKMAIAMDPNDVWGYLILARWEKESWRFKVANDLLDKAESLDPNSHGIIAHRAIFASETGRIELAIKLTLEQIRFNPLDGGFYQFLAENYWMNGEFLKAEATLQKDLDSHPDSGWSNGFMGQIQLCLGRPEKALEYIEKQKNPDYNLYLKTMAVYAKGDIKEADNLLQKLIGNWGEIAWPNIAYVYAFRGEKDKAFEWLEIAYEKKDASLLQILSFPEMKNLWGDPRWNKFIEKLGLPADHEFHLD